MTTTEPTVTEALQELRQVFPNAVVSVQFSYDGRKQWCYLRRRNKVIVSGETLLEAMNVVRIGVTNGELSKAGDQAGGN